MFVIWHVLQITVNFLNKCILPDLINEIILLLYYFQNSSAHIMWIGHNLPQSVACQPAQSLRTWEKPWGVTCPARSRSPPCPRAAIQFWPRKNQEMNLHKTAQAAGKIPPGFPAGTSCPECLPAWQVLLNSWQVGMLANPTKMCARQQLPNTHIPFSWKQLSIFKWKWIINSKFSLHFKINHVFLRNDQIGARILGSILYYTIIFTDQNLKGKKNLTVFKVSSFICIYQRQTWHIKSFQSARHTSTHACTHLYYLLLGEPRQQAILSASSRPASNVVQDLGHFPPQQIIFFCRAFFFFSFLNRLRITKIRNGFSEILY